MKLSLALALLAVFRSLAALASPVGKPSLVARQDEGALLDPFRVRPRVSRSSAPLGHR